MKAAVRSRKVVTVLATMCVAINFANAQTSVPTPDEAAFRAICKELLEINMTRSVGDCTKAAEAMRQRLLAAGYPAADLQILAPPEAPKDGALIAVLRGRQPSVKPMRRRSG